jgi:hypothetical protein
MVLMRLLLIVEGEISVERPIALNAMAIALNIIPIALNVMANTLNVTQLH